MDSCPNLDVVGLGQAIQQLCLQSQSFQPSTLKDQHRWVVVMLKPPLERAQQPRAACGR